MNVRLPDGTLIRNVPDGISKAELRSRLAKNGYDVSALMDAAKTPADPSAEQPNDFLAGLRNFGMGALKGASDIGATLLYPIDKVRDLMEGTGQSAASSSASGTKPLSRNEQRREQLNMFFKENADPESLAFQGGDLAAMLAGTAGSGGLIASAARTAAPRLVATSAGNRLVNAIGSSGMRTGAPAATSLAGQAGDLALRTTGGAISGAASAGLVNPSEADSGAMIGAALPVIGAAVSKPLSAGWNALKGKPLAPEVVDLASRANQLGIEIPADRLVNSRPLNALASALNYVPFAGRAATEDRMSSQLTRAASRLIGQDSDNMTLAIRKAGQDLGQKFDDVLKNNPINFDGQLQREIADHLSTAEKELGSSALKPIQSQVRDLMEKGGSGVIDAQAAYNIKRSLDRISNHPGPEAWHALQLKASLIDALDRSLGPQAAADFANTRQQYSNLIALEKLAKNGAEGDISVARLANLKNINNAPLQEVADIAAQFIKSREGQHGAMQRAFAGLGGAAIGGPVALTKGIALGRGLNTALNSDLMRNALTGAGNPRVENVFNTLGSGFYRLAPALGTQ